MEIIEITRERQNQNHFLHQQPQINLVQVRPSQNGQMPMSRGSQLTYKGEIS